MFPFYSGGRWEKIRSEGGESFYEQKAHLCRGSGFVVDGCVGGMQTVCTLAHTDYDGGGNLAAHTHPDSPGNSYNNADCDNLGVVRSQRITGGIQITIDMVKKERRQWGRLSSYLFAFGATYQAGL
jgi:hypothetical protein